MRRLNRIVAVVSCLASLGIASAAFAEQGAHPQEQPGPGKLVEAPAHFRDVHPPLFFHEEWKAAPGAKEAPITQDAVGNPNLELKLYGDPKDILLSGAAGKPDDPPPRLDGDVRGALRRRAQRQEQLCGSDRSGQDSLVYASLRFPQASPDCKTRRRELACG